MSGVGGVRYRGDGRGVRRQGRAEVLGSAHGRGCLGKRGGLLGGGGGKGRQSCGRSSPVWMRAWSGKEQGAVGGGGPRAVGGGRWAAEARRWQQVSKPSIKAPAKGLRLRA